MGFTRGGFTLKEYSLKFYEREVEEFKEEYEAIISSQGDVCKIVNKLTRHYKMSPITIKFGKHTPNGGTCWYKSRQVSFHREKASIGIVCHEVAHQLLYDQTGKHGHTKKLMTRIRRLNNYCRKMNYWGLSQCNEFTRDVNK